MELEDYEELEGWSDGEAKDKSTERGGRVRREAGVGEFSLVGRGRGATLARLLQSVSEAGEGKAVEKVKKVVVGARPTLDTPLHKPQALKTARTVLYEKAKKDVSRWNPVVYHNRLADQLLFPSHAGQKVPRKTAKQAANDFIPMTRLEEEMGKVLYGEEYVKERKAGLERPTDPSAAETYALSVEEALAQHSEMARLRALQSYEMAKAKRRNKIKSKKYHRLLRKEKIKKQLKEFEELQHKDPEQAMLKLNELEESRVQERMSLKHRNTSKWAKMQSARAKYNKDSRLALNQQLTISRDLTKKIQESSDEEESEEIDIPNLVKSSMNNPWMLNTEVKDNEKLELYYSGYKKLWEGINAKKRAEEREKEEKTRMDSGNEEPEEAVKTPTPVPKKSSKKKKKKKLEVEAEGEGVFTEHDLEGLFEEAESRRKSEAMKVLKKLEREDRAMKRKAKRAVKREEKRPRAGDADELRDLQVNDQPQTIEGEEEDAPPTTINPDKYLKVSGGKRRSKFSEVEYEEEGGMIIADAFEEDDVLHDFRRQKEEAVEASQPKDLDLNLPGWGQWGGKGILPKQNKRFLVKAPPAPPRKDARLSHVILHEEAGQGLREHQVRELPFPFTRVKDFEKTIRAPMGRTWLPEQSTKDLIAPPIITRLGSIIKPIDEDVLAKSAQEKAKDFKPDDPVETGEDDGNEL